MENRSCSAPTRKNSIEAFQKLKIEASYGTAIGLLGEYLE